MNTEKSNQTTNTLEQKQDNHLAQLEETIAKVKEAQKIFAAYSQEKVDHIFREAAFAVAGQRINLAKMAAEETGMGIVEDKVVKNHFASEYIYNKYKDVKTCGIIEEDTAGGMKRIADPVGVIAGVVPTTNPTSTSMFKALISLKTRNGIIFSPHPRAKKATIEAAKIVRDAAVEAGAPKNIIGWISEPTVEQSQHLMSHKDISLILATGGLGMVKAAYSSGTPAVGVGAGNTPAVVDETADIKTAAASILMSKTFDNGMICSSEQSVVAVEQIYERLKEEFVKNGAYFLNEDERKKVANTIMKNGKLNGNIVGQSAHAIAKMAGVNVPENAKVRIAEVEKIGAEEPFSFEKLSPVLAMYKAKEFKDAEYKAIKLLGNGGMGHTSVLYTNPSNTKRIDQFNELMKSGRVLVNMPSAQGAIGDIYNFRLDPSLTLGCGTWGGNSVSGNVGINQLLNIKTSAERRENMLWLQVPPKIYFKYGCLPTALGDLKGHKKAFVVTDKPLYDLGFTDKVTKPLRDMNIDTEIFYEVAPDPTLETVYKGVEAMNEFNPDVIIALGGGSPMDAAKIMWLMYEHPEADFKGLALRFMDIRKRIYEFPELGNKAKMVSIPTTSGTGSEVTPFAVVTDEKTGIKYPIADYQLTPDTAIVDPELVMHMPQQVTAYSGIDALTHAIEAHVSVLATEYTTPYALEATRLLFTYLPKAYRNGANDQEAREMVHYAANLAGLAFANAFLGVCHSMAHKLGAAFDLPHGMANALLINEVIRFNATNAPRKQAIFPQYKYPNAIERYAHLAGYLGIAGKTQKESVNNLINEIDKLKDEIGVPSSIKDAGVDEKTFSQKLEQISENAFDDQCTIANPRYPSIEEIKEMYRNCFDK